MGQEGNYDSDVARLERRLKRRNIDNRYFEKKPSSDALTEIENNAAKETLEELVEYENFMSTCTYEHGDYSNGDVDENCFGVNDDVGDHNEDPQYKMFLENVKQDGESYAVVVFEENGANELLRYEVMGSDGDERGPETPEAIESCRVNERIRGQRILRRLSNGGNREIANSLANFSSEDVLSPRTFRYHARNLRKKECMETSDGGLSIRRRFSNGGNREIANSLANFSSEGDVLSPRTLRYHARNLRKTECMETSDGGLSIRRRVCSAGRNAGRGSSIGSGLEGNHLIEYETQEGEVDDVPRERRKSCLALKRADKELRGPSSGGTSLRSGSESEQFVENEFACDNGDVDEEYNRFLNSINVGPGLEGNFWNQHLSDHEDDLDEEFDRILNSGSRGRSGGSCARLGSEGNFSNQHQSDHEDEICNEDEDDLTYIKPDTHCEDGIDDSDEFYRHVNREYDQENSSDVDQEYVRFLNQQEMDGEDALYRINDSPERFDAVEESESDVEIIAMDRDPYGGGVITPFVSSKQCIDADNYSFAEDPSVNFSQFKKELMEILKMPYNSKEHKALNHEVSYRRWKTQNRIMRNTTKSYPVGTRGKSYLDLHSDFAKLLDQAKNDDLKSFNLLRGFFYWLKHVADDKVFKPWLDPSCLEVLPQKFTGRTIFKSECKQF